MSIAFQNLPLCILALLCANVVAQDSGLSRVQCGPPVAVPDCGPTLSCNTPVDTRDCMTCFIRSPFGGCISQATDPMCEAAKAAQNTSYAASKSACEASKSSQRAQCESTKRSLIVLNAQIAVECRHPGRPNDFTLEVDMDRPSNGDYFDIAAPSLAVCEQICRQDSRCKSFTYLILVSVQVETNDPRPCCQTSKSFAIGSKPG